MEPLSFNFGMMDITPDEPVVLAGYANRVGLSQGIHQPLTSFL